MPSKREAVSLALRQSPLRHQTLPVIIAFVLLSSTAFAQTITGAAFFDPDASGTRSATEIGADEVVITAFDASGSLVAQTASCGLQAVSIAASPPEIPATINVAACAVGSVGNYTLSGLTAATEYRLEASWTDGLQFDSAQGADAGSSVQFAASPGTSVNFGVSFPEDYCESNPRVLAGCYVFPPPFTGIPPWTAGDANPLIISFPYNDRATSVSGGAEVHPHDEDADYGDLGHIFGVSVHRSTRTALFSAISSPLWPVGGAGIGGIYMTDYNNGGGTFTPGSAATFVDLAPLTTLGAANPVTPGVLNRFGEQGIGGIDLSADDEVLWAINMGAGSLLRIAVGNPLVSPGAPDITEIPIPDPGCSSGTFRPGAVTVRRGSVFIGGICDASAAAGAGTSDLSGEVIEYDGIGFTPRFSFPLDFQMGKIFQAVPASFPMVKWQATDDQFEPQPFLTNMVFDDDGSLVLGFMPRLSYHELVQVAGFVVRAQEDGVGGYAMEAGGVTGPYTSSARTAYDGINTFGHGGNPVPGEGPAGSWFYENGLFHSFTSMFHSVLFSAGLTIVPGSGEVAAGYTDPLGVDAFGVRFLNRENGLTTGGTQFGGLKVALVSDVDVICTQAPLEIGNRVWCDGASGTALADNNGIQDPGEAGIAGVSVTLTCGGDTPVTVNTSATGGYLFTDALYLASANATDIPRDASCTVSIDRVAQSALLQAACGTDMATIANNGGADANADLRDSDATDLGGGLAGTSITTGEPGENDHAIDVGIVFAPPASDYGDAPASYGTVAGASHVVAPGATLFLGACVDTEVGGQATTPFGAVSDGDDANDAGVPTSVAGTCAGSDDEDGVSFTSMITACGMASVSVVSQGAGGILSAWIDFDLDGDFLDAGEQILVNQALTGGGSPDVFNYSVPCSAESRVTYARFRVASAMGLTSVSLAADGEVEDYEVTTKGLDFGDAPDTYTTTASPSHVIDPGTPLYLGSCVDSEEMGQPNTNADLDDTTTGLSTLGTCTGNDDEDGVTFDTMIVACTDTNELTVVSVGAGALLDGWIDFNADGDFADTGEQIFVSQALTGNDTVSFTAPCDAASGDSYARFRVSTAGALSFDGQAMDGEVEDYAVVTKGLDFGDAPDTYGTTDGANGPSHVVDPGTPLFLGACVDSEADGQPVVAGNPADGDDLGMGVSTVGNCVGGNDEDGVTFDTMIVACGNADVTFTASSAGMVDAWIDFAGDGVFDASDQVFAAQAVVAGANTETFAVPCDTPTNSVTYARFRLSTVGGLAANGDHAMDGEVEDYEVVTKGVDFGDAPDSYTTSMGTGGPTHALDPNSPLFLGACVDSEVDGQPVAAGNPANGDDLGTGISDLGGCNGTDDEDGVTFDDMVIACGTSNVTVTASQAGRLDAWIDLNGDGDFADAGEQVLAGQAVTAGVNSVSYAVSCSTLTNAVSYARFRLSTAGGLFPGGPAMDGEVEDYEVATKGLDLGDAPEAVGYPTLIASNGARHVVQPTANPSFGTGPDTEPDGQPSASHTGDDQNGVPDDEDGVSFGGVFVPGDGPVDVTVTAGATGGLVNAWIDWNGDGDWGDAGEQIATDLPLTAGASQVLMISAPPGISDGESCARFRIDSGGGLSPTGLAMDGEVEDYPVAIGVEDPVIGIAKELISVENLGSGEHAALFEITVVNLGNVPLSSVQVTVDLATAFADADGFTLDFATSSDMAVNGGFDGDGDALLLDGTDVLDIGETGTVLMRVLVMPGSNAGPYICSSVADGLSPADTPVMDVSQDGGDADPDDNGDPTDNDVPTEVVFPITVLEIPTLGQWGLGLLVLLLAGVGLRAVGGGRLN